jgi:DNA-binding MarR family transcriptional regulator
MDKVRVSRAVSKLLNSGLITRDTDPIDRRRAILKLTNSGQETYRQIIPLVQEVESEIMAALSGTELDGLEHALTQIEAALR